jgi:hypothetical protein
MFIYRNLIVEDFSTVNSGRRSWVTLHIHTKDKSNVLGLCMEEVVTAVKRYFGSRDCGHMVEHISMPKVFVNDIEGRSELSIQVTLEE